MGASEVGDCEEVLARLWQYIDCESDPETCQQLERHLHDCSPCRGAFEFDRSLKLRVRSCADDGRVTGAHVQELALRIRRAITSGPAEQTREDA